MGRHFPNEATCLQVSNAIRNTHWDYLTTVCVRCGHRLRVSQCQVTNPVRGSSLYASDADIEKTAVLLKFRNTVPGGQRSIRTRRKQSFDTSNDKNIGRTQALALVQAHNTYFRNLQWNFRFGYGRIKRVKQLLGRSCFLSASRDRFGQ